MSQNRMLELSANIISSLVRARPTEPHEIPPLMDLVHEGLKRLDAGGTATIDAVSEVRADAREAHLAVSVLNGASDEASVGTRPSDVDRSDPDRDRETGYVRDGIRTVTGDRIVCLDDGRPVTFLSRHLKAIGVDPIEYLSRRRLPDDYPMTAPAYVAEKRRLAKMQGLGRRVKPGGSRGNGRRERIQGRLSPSY